MEKRGIHRVTLGSVPYVVFWGEGQVVFSSIDGLYGHKSRVVVSKSEPYGLLYVECWDNLGGKIPASHIFEAVELAKDILGPDHFPNKEKEKDYWKKQPLFKLVHFGSFWGFRSGLLQIKGRTVFKWGAFSRKMKIKLE